MYCSNCGREIPDNAKFCKYCGYDLSADEPVSACPTEPLEDTSIENVTETEPTTNTANDIKPPRVSRSQRIRRQREIEDARAIENYTVTDAMVSEAATLPKERIVMTEKGKLTALKVKEIVYMVLAVLVMIGTAVALYFIRTTTKPDEDNMSGLVVLGYFLFFIIFFALAVGVDRTYNLMTLLELENRHVTLKKYGFRMEPLTLKDGIVYSLSISGECDECNPEMRGTYNIEWQNNELIAVCSFDRHHLYRIDLADILESEDIEHDDQLHTEENEA